MYVLLTQKGDENCWLAEQSVQTEKKKAIAYAKWLAMSRDLRVKVIKLGKVIYRSR